MPARRPAAARIPERGGVQPVAMRRLSRKRPIAVTRPGQHDERQPPHDMPPPAPVRELLQYVGSHDPDELHAREPPHQNP